MLGVTVLFIEAVLNLKEVIITKTANIKCKDADNYLKNMELKNQVCKENDEKKKDNRRTYERCLDRN